MKNKTLDIKSMALCGLFSALVAVGAFIKIPIPLVPFSLQFLFVNLAAVMLGKKLATISVSAYVIIGLIGIPVFTQGGGIGYIFQPTFGYIIGFIFGAWTCGYIIEKRGDYSTKTVLLGSFANYAIVYILGMAYYYLIAMFYLKKPIGVWPLMLHCWLATTPSDVTFCILSAIFGKRLHSLTQLR